MHAGIALLRRELSAETGVLFLPCHAERIESGSPAPSGTAFHFLLRIEHFATGDDQEAMVATCPHDKHGLIHLPRRCAVQGEGDLLSSGSVAVPIPKIHIPMNKYSVQEIDQHVLR